MCPAFHITNSRKQTPHLAFARAPVTAGYFPLSKEGGVHPPPCRQNNTRGLPSSPSTPSLAPRAPPPPPLQGCTRPAPPPGRTAQTRRSRRKARRARPARLSNTTGPLPFSTPSLALPPCTLSSLFLFFRTHSSCPFPPTQRIHPTDLHSVLALPPPPLPLLLVLPSPLLSSLNSPPSWCARQSAPPHPCLLPRSCDRPSL